MRNPPQRIGSVVREKAVGRSSDQAMDGESDWIGFDRLGTGLLRQNDGRRMLAIGRDNA